MNISCRLKKSTHIAIDAANTTTNSIAFLLIEKMNSIIGTKNAFKIFVTPLKNAKNTTIRAIVSAPNVIDRTVTGAELHAPDQRDQRDALGDSL